MENIKQVLKALIDAMLHLKEVSADVETLEELQNEIDSTFETVMNACNGESEAAEGP